MLCILIVVFNLYRVTLNMSVYKTIRVYESVHINNNHTLIPNKGVAVISPQMFWLFN